MTYDECFTIEIMDTHIGNNDNIDPDLFWLLSELSGEYFAFLHSKYNDLSLTNNEFCSDNSDDLPIYKVIQK